MTDRPGADRAVLIVLVGLALALAVALIPAIVALGALTYASVPDMRVRVIASPSAPNALAAATGPNIARFNSSIAIGSLLGGGVIRAFERPMTALIGVGTAEARIILLRQRLASAEEEASADGA